MKVVEKLIELQELSYPLRFELQNANSIIEIQYFVEQKMGINLDAKVLHFAVTTDGWDLLVSGALDSDSIMQREIDDIDFLDLTLTDLLKAKKVSI